jgi:hypothetical protein
MTRFPSFDCSPAAVGHPGEQLQHGSVPTGVTVSLGSELWPGATELTQLLLPLGLT